MRYEQVLDELKGLSDEHREDFQLELYDLLAEDTDLESRSENDFNLDGPEIFNNFCIEIPDENIIETEEENQVDRDYLKTEIGEHLRLARFHNFLDYVPLLKRKVDDARLGTYNSFEERSIRPDKKPGETDKDYIERFCREAIEELEEHARKAQMSQIAESENNEVKQIVENEFIEALENIVEDIS